MLQRINRLCKKKEIDGVFLQGKSIKEGYLVLKFAKNQLNSTRFCFVVSKRVSKTAVGRNLLKRRMREIARAALPGLKSGYDLVLIAVPGLEKKDYPGIESAMTRCFSRSGVIIGDKL